SNRLTTSSDTMKFIIYSRTSTSCPGLQSLVASNNVRVDHVSLVRHLGIIIDESLSFKHYKQAEMLERLL
ncbi:hypothetical protein QYM36_017103, partial [Artemia franciscana]